MHLIFSTPVTQSIEQVWSGFNRQLLEQLSPPFPPVRIIRFDGSHTGDLVQMRLNFFVFHQDWTSEIVDQQQTADEIYFIDEGRMLPFFLTYWRHKHRLVRRGDHTEIIDDITFRSPFRLTDWLLYPILYVQFAYRSPIYRKLFGRA